MPEMRTEIKVVESLEEMYQIYSKFPSDIHEHMPLLRQLAAECDHVTEMGVRRGMSTVALLAGQPKTLISWDIDSSSIINQHIANLVALRGKTDFQPRVGDTLKIPPIEQTDMLFIDTLHTADQLLAELKRHADPKRDTVRKYLVMHDTITFGDVGEDGKQPGLRGAIRFFQKCHAFPLWRLIEDRKNNNGLVVLKHVRWD